MTQTDLYFLEIFKQLYTDNACYKNLNTYDIEPSELIDLSLKQGVASFVCDYVYKSSPNFALLPILKDCARNNMLKFYTLEGFTLKIAKLFKENDISFVLLKGISLSYLYPQPDFRPSSDVDIYLPHKEDFAKAEKLLCDMGMTPEEEEHPENNSDHHTCFYMRQGNTRLVLELHFNIVGRVAFEPANRLIDEVFDSSLSLYDININGTNFKILEPSSYVFYMLYHMLKHYLYSGLNVRLLLDIIYFCKAYKDNIDFDLIEKWCTTSGMYSFYETVFSTCVYYFGYEWHKKPIEKAKCESFIDIVLHEYKKDDKSTLSKSRVYDKVNALTYFKEGHYQMIHTYKKASKCFLLWPALWILTYKNFLKNNKEIRNTSTRQMLKQFKHQNEVAKQIPLFEKDVRH